MLETEYYVTDLPKILKAYRKQRAQNDLRLLALLSYPQMSDESRKAIDNELRREAGFITDVTNAKFDRAAFERLRNLGNN